MEVREIQAHVDLSTVMLSLNFKLLRRELKRSLGGGMIVLGLKGADNHEIIQELQILSFVLDVLRNPEKLLVHPASRYSMVIGCSMASGVRALFQALIILPVALIIGVRFIQNSVYFTLAFMIIFIHEDKGGVYGDRSSYSDAPFLR